MGSQLQKKLGAYYTPESVTDCLSKWAIRQITDHILEPSFGGCNFLISAIATLETLGTRDPSRQIFGFDIDENAFDILEARGICTHNFLRQDFLKTEGVDRSSSVNVVLGNPPYLPIRKLAKEYREQIIKLFEKSDIVFSKKSSLWIYFVAHSLKFLKVGGRAAWVLPDSLTFTHYGKLFLNQLSKRFREIRVVRIEERYFQSAGTKEKTSFLLCDGFLEGHCEPTQVTFDLLDQGISYVENLNSGIHEIQTLAHSETSPLSEKYKWLPLAELFDIRIGIVVGATKLLTFNKAEAEKLPYFPDYLYPIVTKGKQLRKLEVNKVILAEESENLPFLLLDCERMQESAPTLFKQLLKSIPDSILSNQTFSKRARLFGYDDFKHPDAFLTFFTQGRPRFVINEDKQLNCTNSVHRLYNKGMLDNHLLKFLAIQFYTEFNGKSIDSLARHYGNSIRKFEPSDANKIPVIVPETIGKLFRSQVDELFDRLSSAVNQQGTDQVIIESRRALTKMVYG